MGRRNNVDRVRRNSRHVRWEGDHTGRRNLEVVGLLDRYMYIGRQGQNNNKTGKMAKVRLQENITNNTTGLFKANLYQCT